MSVFSVTHTDAEPIPRPVGKSKTRYVIVSLPQNLIVKEGTAQRSISADLDPGKYRLVVSQLVSGGVMGRATLMKWRKDFYHDCTPEQHEALLSAPLRFSKGMQTSDGVTYVCQLPGCSNEVTSRTAAVMHEAEHSGVDLFAKPNTHPGDIPPPKVNLAAVEAKVRDEANDRIAHLRTKALTGKG